MDHIVDCLIYQVNPHQAITCSRSSAKHLTQFNWIRLLARLTEYTEVCLRLDSWSGDELYNSISSVDDYCADLVQASSATRLKHERSDTSRMATLCNFLFSLLSAYSEDLVSNSKVFRFFFRELVWCSVNHPISYKQHWEMSLFTRD